MCAAHGVCRRRGGALAGLTWVGNDILATNYTGAKRRLSKDGAISPAALAGPLGGSPKMPI